MNHKTLVIALMGIAISAQGQTINFDTVPGRSGPLDNDIFTSRPIVNEYPGIEFFPDPRTSLSSGPVVLRYEQGNPASGFVPPRNGSGALYLWPGLNNRPFSDRPQEVRPMVDFLNMIFPVPVTSLSYWLQIRPPSTEGGLPFDGLYARFTLRDGSSTQERYFSAPSTSGWTLIQMTFSEANPLESIAFATVFGRNGLNSLSPQVMAVDDLSFTPVPGPSAGAALALGLFALAKRRERR